MGFPLAETPERVKVRLQERRGRFYVIRRNGKGWETIAGPFDNRDTGINFLIPGFLGKLADWSIQVKMRDGYACMCGELQKALLEAHHIKPKDLFPEVMFELENGITKCLWGHAVAHKDNPRIRDMILARLAVAIFPHLYPDSVKEHGIIEL